MLKLKKSCAVFIAVLLLLSSVGSVSATAFSSETSSGIIEAIRAAEGIKTELGLSHLNFEDFSVGNPIPVYDYKDGSLVKSGDYYPLFIDNELTAFAIQIMMDNAVTYQFSTTYVSDIHRLRIGNNTPYAFIFDCDATYLYYNENIIQIKISGTYHAERGNLEECSPALFTGITLQNMAHSTSVGYINQPLNVRSLNTYIRCEVDFVPQNNYDICWAASIACIVNYLNTQDYTAYDVATDYYGQYFNQGLAQYQEVNILRSYGINYASVAKKNGQNAQFSLFKYNIERYYPIYAYFMHSGGDHACVVYGVEDTAKYVYIMEPNTGFVTLSYSTSNGYYFMLPGDNYIYTFAYSTCKYTSVPA